MNIVYVLHSTDMSAGSTKSFQRLLSDMMEKGVYPIVVVPDSRGLYAWLIERGVETIVLTYRPATYTYHRTCRDYLLFPIRQIARLWVNRQAYKKLSVLLLNRKLDLVHTNVSVIDVGKRVAKHFGIPHVYHFREYADLDFHITYFPSSTHFHRKLRKDNDYTICITSDIQRHHGLSDSCHSRVIYNGIHERCTSWNARTIGDYFLYLGRIEPAKGVFLLVQAYANYVRLVDNPLPLRLAGKCTVPSYMNLIKDYIAEQHIEDYVEWLGNRAEVASLCQAARALIVPSEFEGFGRCMPEAMFEGCLVVGHDTGGIKEQFDNGLIYCGEEIGYRYNTLEELIQHLVHLHGALSSELDRIRKNAFDVVNALYSMEKNCEQTFEFYTQILNSDV